MDKTPLNPSPLRPPATIPDLCGPDPASRNVRRHAASDAREGVRAPHIRVAHNNVLAEATTKADARYG